MEVQRKSGPSQEVRAALLTAPGSAQQGQPTPGLS
jgi:hypothetical protein